MPCVSWARNKAPPSGRKAPAHWAGTYRPPISRDENPLNKKLFLTPGSITPLTRCLSSSDYTVSSFSVQAVMGVTDKIDILY